MMTGIGRAAALAVALGSAGAAHADGAVIRPDGSEIVYALEGRGEAERQGVIFIAQGSGCAPATTPGRFEGAEALAPALARLTIEKYGVDPEVGEPETDESGAPVCSEAFLARDTLDQRVLDAARVIAELRRTDWWNGELVLFGGSEGGAVAAMLAEITPETDGVVVFSSGLGFTVEETVLAAMPPPVRPRMSQGLSEARAQGRIDVGFAGHSQAWWANAAAKRPVNALLNVTAPILVVHGGRDASAPVASAREGVERLREAGACVAYHEHADLDHFMAEADGTSRRGAVYADIAAWIDGALEGEACAQD